MSFSFAYSSGHTVKMIKTAGKIWVEELVAKQGEFPSKFGLLCHRDPVPRLLNTIISHHFIQYTMMKTF